MRDEILDEVRARKEALAEQFNFDIRRIVADIKKSEIQTEAEGWHHVQPVHPAVSSEFQKIRFSHR